MSRGIDPNKDQSYFLCGTPKDALSNVLFLGGMYKTEVRRIAQEAGLATATKKIAQGFASLVNGLLRVSLSSL